jgi:hypothetical protein
MRLVARLVEPAMRAEVKAAHVMWVSACAGDAGLLQTPIGGTPEEYARHSQIWLRPEDLPPRAPGKRSRSSAPSRGCSSRAASPCW